VASPAPALPSSFSASISETAAATVSLQCGYSVTSWRSRSRRSCAKEGLRRCRMDYATDAILQKTIRTEFRDSTVITVAHRIPTVMDCDMVLATSDGMFSS